MSASAAADIEEVISKGMREDELLINQAEDELTHCSDLSRDDTIVQRLVTLLGTDNGDDEACVEALLRLCICSRRKRMRAVEGGGVMALLHFLIPTSQKAVCEKALSLMKLLLSCEDGRGAAMQHASAVIPVITKKLLRVSEGATDLGVSILWSMRDSPQFTHQLKEAGGLGKLVTILQVTMNPKTKQRAGFMIKLLSCCRNYNSSPAMKL